MKEKKLLILFIIFIVVVGLGTSLYFYFTTEIPTDACQFAKEYPKVSKENPFVYRDQEELLKILENGTGIVYLGFPECPWCQSYVKYLSEIAKEEKVSKIFYYNILKDRSENNDFYQKLVNILKDKLQYDDEGNKRIFVPALIIINEGNIVGFDDETAWDTLNYKTPEEYWEKEDLEGFKKKLKTLLAKDNPSYCTSGCNN